MGKNANTPLKVVYIYGSRYDRREGSIIIKPDATLNVCDGDTFALMFYRDDRLKDDNVWVTLSSDYPLQDIFDTQDPASRCPLGLDGRVELKDNSFVTLIVKLNPELPQEEINISVQVQWANLKLSKTGSDDDFVYPPLMEVRVNPS